MGYSCNISSHVERLITQAGLLDLRFHDLGHTSVTLLLEQGLDPKSVLDRIGHADLGERGGHACRPPVSISVA